MTDHLRLIDVDDLSPDEQARIVTDVAQCGDDGYDPRTRFSDQIMAPDDSPHSPARLGIPKVSVWDA